MKRIILICGGIIGILLSINGIVVINILYSNPEFKGNDLVGYTIMVAMFSLIYFGVRNYRNNHLGGKINFLRALKIGALICLIASTIYTVLGLGYYHFFAPDFIDVYAEHVIKNTAPDQVEAVTTQMANFKEMYKNPLFAIFITYLEVLPVGMIVALISALIVRRK